MSIRRSICRHRSSVKQLAVNVAEKLSQSSKLYLLTEASHRSKLRLQKAAVRVVESYCELWLAPVAYGRVAAELLRQLGIKAKRRPNKVKK